MNKIIYFDITSEIEKCENAARTRAGMEYDNYHRNRRANFAVVVITFVLIGCLYIIDGLLIPIENFTWVRWLLLTLTLILTPFGLKSLSYIECPPKLAMLEKEKYNVSRNDFIASYHQLFDDMYEEYKAFLSKLKSNDIREISALPCESGDYILNYAYVVKHDDPVNVNEIKSYNSLMSLEVKYIDEASIYLDIPNRTLYIPYIHKNNPSINPIHFDLEMVNINKGD